MDKKMIMAALAMATSIGDVHLPALMPLTQNPGRQWRPKQRKKHNEAIEAAAQAKRDRKNRLRLERMKK